MTAQTPAPTNTAPRLILIGTAETVAAMARQFQSPGLPVPAGCVLVRPALGRVIAGLPVLGDLANLHALHASAPISLAAVSLPAEMLPLTLKVRATLRRLAIPERFVPTLADLLEQPAGVASSLPHELDLVELIGRTPYGIDRRAVARVTEGKRVLITGAGGSIGSEICRIVATFGPEQIILMERAENALFEIDRQLARRFPDIPRRAVLHDVVDEHATLRHLAAFRPHTIFHAAAHKHVPLMEDHPSHAVRNNLFGTRSIADAAAAVGAERFVMISSDKAVNPTSVMGATKRLAEMYTQSMNARHPRTSFTMVRFGNVLGSACSVLPIWSSQLAEGGPITVTDERMTRFFMTIHEAAALVIQAAAIDAHAPGPQPTVLVLDMGEPVRILDLAKRFVRLHGFTPRVVGGSTHADTTGPSIDITLTGARPGEKLYEELAYDAEALLPTPYPGIHALAASIRADFDVGPMVSGLDAACRAGNHDDVLNAIRCYVPEMRPQGAAFAESKQYTNKGSSSKVAAA